MHDNERPQVKGQYVPPEVNAETALDQVRANDTTILYGTRTGEALGWQKQAAKVALKSAQLYIKKNGAVGWWDVFCALMEGQIEQNCWTGQMKLKGTPGLDYTVEQMLGKAEKVLGARYAGSESKAKRWLASLLTEHHAGRRFNPVKRYLEELNTRLVKNEETGRAERRRWEPTDEDLEMWFSLGKRLFGTDDPLTQRKFTRWLIGTAARGAVDENGPSVKMDNMLILYSAQQGLNKSRFAQSLGKGYAGDLQADRNLIELQRAIAGMWIAVVDEVDAIFGRQGNSAIKSVLTLEEDSIRRMHANDATKHIRHNTFIGTTNQRHLFSDGTGTRRFLVVEIPDGHQIPVLGDSEVDDIWRMAYYLYLQGERFWDNPKEQAENEAFNARFKAVDPLQEKLYEVITYGKEPNSAESWFITFPMACELLDIKINQQRKYAKAISAAFAAMGWVKVKRRFKDGSRPEGYMHKDAKTFERLTDAHKLLQRNPQTMMLEANEGAYEGAED